VDFRTVADKVGVAICRMVNKISPKFWNSQSIISTELRVDLKMKSECFNFWMCINKRSNDNLAGILSVCVR